MRNTRQTKNENKATHQKSITTQRDWNAIILSVVVMKHRLKCEKGEFGISSVIGIAIGLIVAAFILIPGIQTFASKIISDMQLWWTNSISTQIFPN
ncbi:hypothetical protein [Fusibacter bizertensis]